MNKQVAPGQLAAIKGAVVRCFNCGAVEIFTAEVKGGWHTHAKMYGWKALKFDPVSLYANWHCPKCVAQREAQATTTERDAFGVPYNREPAPIWSSDKTMSTPEDFKRDMIASAARVEPRELKLSAIYIEPPLDEVKITVNGERILDIAFRMKPGDILTTSYPDIDGTIIKQTFKVDADGIHLIPLES